MIIMKLKPSEQLKWPDNLLSIIFEKEIKYPITNERTALIENVIRETIPMREGDVLFMYYKDAITSAKIGEKYNVTSERIRQMLYKAIRKMRVPNRLKLFFPQGFEDYDEQGTFTTLEEMEEANKNAEVENKQKEVKISVDSGEIIKRVIQTIESGMPISNEDFKSMLDIMPMENLYMKLNVRACNGILRSGIVNIVQLLYALQPIFKDENVVSNYICSVANIGIKSYLDILNALDKLFNIVIYDNGIYDINYIPSFYAKYSHMKKYTTSDKPRTEEALYKSPDKYWWYKAYPSGDMFEKINSHKKRMIDDDKKKKESIDSCELINKSKQNIVDGYEAFALKYEPFHLPRLNEVYPYNLISAITRKEIESINRSYGNIVTQFEDIVIAAINKTTNNNERLTNRLCYILTLRFKYNKTYLEISGIMGITSAIARETVDSLISAIRNYMNNLPYKYFPDSMFTKER